MLIQTAHAATSAQLAAQCLVNKINDAILFPLVALLMALAFLYFLWGAFEFVKNANNESARETGKQHMLFGTIGMLVMLSAYAILNIAAGTFGLSGVLSDATNSGTTRSAPCSSPRPPTRPAGGGSVPTNPTTPGGSVPTNPTTPGGSVPTNPTTPGGSVPDTTSGSYDYAVQEMVTNGVTEQNAIEAMSVIDLISTRERLETYVEQLTAAKMISQSTGDKIIQDSGL